LIIERLKAGWAWQVRQICTIGGCRVARFYRLWEGPNRFGNLAVLGFLLVQCLDGAFTYLGIHTWGLTIEANPLVSTTVLVAGLGPGVMAAKGLAIALGIVLHLRRVHTIVAVLTLVYFTVAILPWTALFLAN
jgi:hypothetical protein